MNGLTLNIVCLRVHFIQCPQGMMNKHMEKLVHCDPRLQSLSQQNDFALDNLYFQKCSIFEDTEDINCRKFEQKNDNQLAPLSSNALLSPQCSASRMDAEVRQQSGTSDVLPGPYHSSGEFQYPLVYFPPTNVMK